LENNAFLLFFFGTFTCHNNGILTIIIINNQPLRPSSSTSVLSFGGVEIEHVAISTGGRIVARVEELSADEPGIAGKVEQVALGTNNSRRQDRLLVL
jgi:hypothetical protein